MKIVSILALGMAAVFVSAESPPPAPIRGPDASSLVSRLDIKSHFGDFEGCFVIKSLNDNWIFRYNEPRCDQRLSPCSTFKIFSSLAGLQSGALKGPEDLKKWDGSTQTRKECEKDHTLATAIRDSVVWYFQQVAQDVGAEAMQKFLNACDYGDRNMSSGLTNFWLMRSLNISANEQVRFLERMYTGKLPFEAKHVETVQRLIVYRASDNWVLSGKTGSGGTPFSSDEITLGWYVGHVKHGDREFVFATNISGKTAMGLRAREISANILRAMGLIEFPGKFE